MVHNALSNLFNSKSSGELAKQMYAEWSREKQKLEMTTTMIGLYLDISKIKAFSKHQEALINLKDVISMHAKNEWGKDTKVKYYGDYVMIENGPAKRSAKVAFDKKGIVIILE